MCEDCGCGEANEEVHGHTHTKDGYYHTHDGKKHFHPNESGHGHSHDHHDHDHEHSHEHSHDHEHSHSHEHKEHKTVTVEQKVLAHNDEIAEANRKFLEKHGVVAVNIISSPGAGKTKLLEKTLDMLQDKVKCAVIVGDQRTDNDAQRLIGKGAEVRQIETYSSCHLNAEQVGALLPEIVDSDTQLLFIENIGNLVCPAAFELGEAFKVAMLSTTEGEDKAVKYPVLFSKAQITVLNKTDLIPHLDWDLEACRKNIRKVHPGMFIFEVSAKTGEGMQSWIDYLTNLII